MLDDNGLTFRFTYYSVQAIYDDLESMDTNISVKDSEKQREDLKKESSNGYEELVDDSDGE